MSVCIISFSARENGNCGQIGEYIRGFYAEPVRYYDFSKLAIEPCGRCSYECFADNMKCPYMGDREYEICDAVAGSDLAYFIVPNYCDYPCANFFIFNERGQCYFQGHPQRLNDYRSVPKKFIVISNTGQENFRTAFADHVGEAVAPDILFLKARSYNKVSIDGNLLTSDEAKDDIKSFVLGCSA